MRYVIRRKSKDPQPSLASAKKVALFLISTVAASTAVTLKLMPIDRLTEASRSIAVDVVLAAHNADVSFNTKIDEAGIKLPYEVRELFDATDEMRADLVGYVGCLAEAAAERARGGRMRVS